jgi:hypothetical protein
MLVIAHSENTFNKKKMREDLNNPTVKKTDLKLKNFVSEAPLREFYNALT